MTITPGAYLKLRRTAAGMSIADVAARLRTVPRIAEHIRAEQLQLIEADVQPANLSTIVALQGVYSFDLRILIRLSEIQLGIDREPPRLCKICGCSEWDACPGRCAWVGLDACSSCLSPAAQSAIAA
jgi:transcriptional regulator with XRE-family HTH domain